MCEFLGKVLIKWQPTCLVLALLFGSVHADLMAPLPSDPSIPIYDFYQMEVIQDGTSKMDNNDEGLIPPDNEVSLIPEASVHFPVSAGQNSYNANIISPSQIELEMLFQQSPLETVVIFSELDWIGMEGSIGSVSVAVSAPEGITPVAPTSLVWDARSFTAVWSDTPFEATPEQTVVFTITPQHDTVIPEPSTYALLGSMALVAIVLRRRRSKVRT